MRRTFRAICVAGIGLLLVVGGLTPALADFPPGEWVSGITAANMTDEEAQVIIVFYDNEGEAVATLSGGTIGPHSSKSWYLPGKAPDLPSGFIGSAVLYSDKQLAARINTQLPQGSNPMRGGATSGVASPSPTMYAPKLFKAAYGWNSYCAVQNAGDDEGTITATYYANGAVVDTDAVSVKALASYMFDQSADPELPVGGQFSAKFEGDGDHPIAVLCNYYNSGAAAGSMHFHSYSGMAGGGTTLYIPRVTKDYQNYNAALKVQNIGTVPLSVTVTYNLEGTVYTQDSSTIQPYQSWGPYLGNEAHLPPSMAGVSGWGSAVVEVNDPGVGKEIIAIVDQFNPRTGGGAVYAAAVSSEASYGVVFPQITSEFLGYSSGIQIMKIEAGTANCSAHFSASGAVSAFDQPFSLIDANPSWQQWAPTASGMVPGIANDNYNGSVTVTCTGAKVIGITNMGFEYVRDNRYGRVLGDTLTSVRGINN